MVTAVIRCRREEPVMMDEERDIRENTVRYDDEGGGEEDTEAFDMSALRHLNQIKLTMDLAIEPPKSKTYENRLLQEFIRDRLLEADLDPAVPPFDSLQTYTFEGSKSAPESLSSLDSLDLSYSEQSNTFLKGWGPRFDKLADLYGHREGGAFPNPQTTCEGGGAL